MSNKFSSCRSAIIRCMLCGESGCGGGDDCGGGGGCGGRGGDGGCESSGGVLVVAVVVTAFVRVAVVIVADLLNVKTFTQP